MFQFIPVDEDNIIAIRVSGEISHQDYQDFLPQIEAHIATQDDVALLIELENIRVKDNEVLKDDFNFILDHRDVFSRIAIVGDRLWEHWMTVLARPFIKGDVNYFSHESLQQAWDWVREKKLSDDQLADRQIIPYQKIVVAVDFSPHSRHAAKRAIEISDHYGAELRLLNIVNEAALYDLYYEPAGIGFLMSEFSLSSIEGITSLIDSMKQTARTNLHELIGELDLEKNQGVVLAGKPKTTVISYAEAQAIDLIIMGTHGKRGLSTMTGSTTHYVQSHARCEVLSVPLHN